ncbi:MAG: HEAT repeat domain-containing protein [Myxococcales bacterium]|jgi:HEAT repeat protein|nr:HEAT repeat domain-containing protein [Myxococcales bacterium]
MKTSTWQSEGAPRRGHLKYLLLCAACAIPCACASLGGQSHALPKEMTDQELVNTLDSGDARQRAEACARLGDNKSTLAIQRVGEAAEKDASQSTRESCIDALAKIGTPASATVLGRIAKDEQDEEMRIRALDALDKVDAEEASVPTVTQILKNDKSLRVRKRAAEIIGEKKWKSGIPALSELVKSNDAPLELRTESLTQLFKMGDASANEVVFQTMTRSDSVDLRRKAAELVADHPPASAFKPLNQALSDQDEQVATSAIEGLVKLKDPSAATALRQAAQQRTDKLADKMNEAADKLSK